MNGSGFNAITPPLYVPSEMSLTSIEKIERRAPLLARAHGWLGDASAGTRCQGSYPEPSPIRPQTIEAMREIGIYISGQGSKSVDEF